MARYVTRYCSWCFKKTRHRLTDECLLERNEYLCSGCRNYTIECRAPGCRHMTKGRPGPDLNDEDGSWYKRFKKNWNSEFCAEHDGTIGSFERLTLQLTELEDFEEVFKRDTVNLAKAGKIVVAAAGGAVIAAPLAVVAAPAAAAALGSAGLLGVAGTGTAIATLHGAALTSASLAAIGGGAMTGGVVVVSAVGGALGAVQGAVVGNSYFGQVQDFNITKWSEGDGPAVIFINGLLQQNVFDPRDWRRGLRAGLKGNPWYHLNWESKTLASFWGKTLKGGSAGATAGFATKFAARAAKLAGSKINPLTWAAFAADLAGNPWHVAMAKASMTGVLLADLIARTQKQEFILMGHSLGARVVYYTLQALSTKKKKFICDAYLFGGAVDRRDDKGWATATKAVTGTIHNCHSNGDQILKGLYRGANAMLSDPVGLGPIRCDSVSIQNHDFSKLIRGHMEWKQKLDEVLKQVSTQSKKTVAERRKAKGPAQKPRCKALTKSGCRCSRSATKKGFCTQHSKQGG